MSSLLQSSLKKLRALNESAATANYTVVFKAKSDSALSDSQIRKEVANWDKDATLTQSEDGTYTYVGANGPAVVRALKVLQVDFVDDNDLDPDLAQVSESDETEDEYEDEDEDDLRDRLMPVYEKLKKVMESEEFDVDAFATAFDEFTDKAQECLRK